MMTNHISILLKQISDLIKLESVNDYLKIDIDYQTLNICALDSAFLMSSDLFIELVSNSNDRNFVFVHYYDQVTKLERESLDICNYIQNIDLEYPYWRDEFLIETSDYDAISYNFKNGLVIPFNLNWAAICLVQCDVALVFGFEGSGSYLEAIRNLCYSPSVALKLLGTCLDSESIKEISAKLN